MIDTDHFDHESIVNESNRYDGSPNMPNLGNIIIVMMILGFIVFLATFAS